MRLLIFSSTRHVVHVCMSTFFSSVGACLFKAGPLRYKQPTNKLKTRISNQYTLFDSSRFSHSDCGTSPEKTYVNKRTLLEEKYWRKVGSNQQPLDHRPFAFPTELRRLICRLGFKLLLILHCIAHGMMVTCSYDDIPYNVLRH